MDTGQTYEPKKVDDTQSAKENMWGPSDYDSVFPCLIIYSLEYDHTDFNVWGICLWIYHLSH